MTDDGRSGIALKDDEIVSLYAHRDSSHPGAANSMLETAVATGGQRLDCFDTVPAIYAKSGFVPVARLKWNDDYAPTAGDYNTYSAFDGGRPDVILHGPRPGICGLALPARVRPLRRLVRRRNPRGRSSPWHLYSAVDSRVAPRFPGTAAVSSSCGVDCFGQRFEAGAARAQIFDGLQQVGDDRLNRSRRQMTSVSPSRRCDRRSVSCRPGGRCAGRGFGRDLETAGSAECVALRVDALIGSRDPRVAQKFHLWGSSVPELTDTPDDEPSILDTSFGTYLRL